MDVGRAARKSSRLTKHRCHQFCNGDGQALSTHFYSEPLYKNSLKSSKDILYVFPKNSKLVSVFSLKIAKTCLVFPLNECWREDSEV